jgi:hypothetical protein
MSALQRYRMSPFLSLLLRKSPNPKMIKPCWRQVNCKSSEMVSYDEDWTFYNYLYLPKPAFYDNYIFIMGFNDY